MTQTQITNHMTALEAGNVWHWLSAEISLHAAPEHKVYRTSLVILQEMLDSSLSPYDADDVNLALCLIADALERMGQE